MIRAFGATVGSMFSLSSQLIHCGFSLVPAFLHQLSSGWAPRPWIATMLGRSVYVVEVSTGKQAIRKDVLDDLRFLRWCLAEHLEANVIVGYGPALAPR